MAVPLLDLTQQHAQLRLAIQEAFNRVLSSGKFVVPSPDVDAFEHELASFCGTASAIGVSSGTDALIQAMMALGIGAGDEVITSPFTFFATAGSVARLGAKPVFVDVDPGSHNIDSRKIQAAITPQTKAIIPVHLFGLMADMGAVMAIAEKHGLKVIEDAAQSIGATDRGRPAGSIGDVGCLSFYPTKNLAALGDGGACVTSDKSLDSKMRSLRIHGQTGEYQHEFIGGNFRLDAIMAAILRVKLPHLKNWISARQTKAIRYHQLLAGLPLVLPIAPPDKQHAYNLYTVRVRDGKRDALKKHLSARGIGNKVYYPLPLHLQPCFAYLGGKRGQFPESERATEEVLSLPIFADMTDAQQDEVVREIRGFFQGG